ncbi:hypothetical protein M885DRAFT_128075 [Pelagophyceae sp. CCMP2097]|nr:hypothetical protein M885DRAFT_128075 [Pelagophyceae sp. CCMP2097]
MEASRAAVDGGATDDEARFLAWLREHGADTSKLRWPVKDEDSGDRIAVAAVDVAQHEAVMSLPEKLLITPACARADEVIGDIVVRHNMRGDVLLATFLLHEVRKGDASFWAPYLRVLPAAPASVCNWSAEETAQLCDAELAERANGREMWVGELHDRYFTQMLTRDHPGVFPAADFSAEKFRFAWLIVQSRAFGRRLKETALVPYADCLNHCSHVETSYHLVDGHFQLFSTQKGYAAGREVVNSYGPNPNSKLLLDYGFAILDNPRERIRFTMTLDCNDDLCPRKRDVLRRADAAMFQAIELARGEFPTAALVFVRVAGADEAGLARLEAAADPRLPTACTADEVKALRVLLERLRHVEKAAALDGDGGDLHARLGADLRACADAGADEAQVEAAARALHAMSHRLTRKRIATSVRELVDTALQAVLVTSDALRDDTQRAGDERR